MERRVVWTALTVLLLLAVLVPVPARAAACGTGNAALNRPATASSVESGACPAPAAFDGNSGTRWSSAFADPQWIRVDLGAVRSICKVVLTWEAAYGRDFRIQASPDGASWTDLRAVTGGTGGTAAYGVAGSGRYVRMYGTARGTGWGYSLWEFAIHVDDGEDPPVGGGDLGPNVHVFDPSMPSPAIQTRLDDIFRQQESAQFGTGRHALFFKPGTYHGLNAQIGFYTAVHGLGRNPGGVTINGDITVDAGWFGGNATQNFWRSTENLTVVPVNGTNRWAVSQAAPFRRMHIRGGLNLAPTGYGWASGGYIADSRIDGTVGPYSQQQWYTRDSSIGGWLNGVWNKVFSGVIGSPGNTFPEPPYTDLSTTPISREKPYIYLEGDEYRVFVPAKRTNARGASWQNGPTPGTSLPLSQFYVAKPGDSAARINAALAQGLHLLLTPGIYRVNQPITVNRAGTVVLGLGLATIIPENGTTAVKVADVDGVRLAGFLVDAGPVNSATLVEVGPAGSRADHAADPTTVQDVFVRIGGAGAGKATTSMVVNSDDVIIDHTWLWRADHGSGVGWETNRADYGLVVNGDDVLATGLFAEHFNKHDVQWYGERGRTIFFQNEKAYDAPNQEAIQNGSIQGFAAYRVADSVNTHEAWGVGSYCFYNVDPTIRQDHGFQTPVKPGIRFHHVLVVSLGGNGQYNHVINDAGAPTSGTSTIPSVVVSYP